MTLRLAFATRIAAAAVIMIGGSWATLVTMENEFAITGVFTPLGDQVRHTSAVRSILASLALGHNKPSDAIRFAGESLSQRPLDATTLRLYALGLLDTGATDRGAETLTLASQLGWRDIATQRLLLGFALSAKDMKSAAIRSDALLRQKRNTEQVFDITRAMLPEPGAPAALAERLAGRPNWRSEFMMSSDRLPGNAYAGYQALLSELRSLDSPAEPREINAFERTLMLKGMPAQAIAVSRQFGALRQPNGADFGPIAQGDDVSPFIWAVTPGLEVALSQPTARSVRVETDGHATDVYLSRVLPVSPGTHGFGVTLREGGAKGDGAFAWTFTCLPSGTTLPSQLDVTPFADRQEMTYKVAIPSNCFAVRIALSGRGNQIPGIYSVTFANARWH